MMIDILEISTIVTSAVTYIFWSYRCQIPKLTLVRQLGLAAAYVAIWSLYCLLGFNYRPYVMIILTFTYLSIGFRGNIETRIYCAALPTVIDGVIEVIVLGIFFLLPSASYETIDIGGTQRVYFVITAKAVVVLTFFLMSIGFPRERRMRLPHCLVLTATLLGCWLVLLLIFHNPDIELDLSPSEFLLCGFALLLMSISSIVLYTTLTSQEEEISKSIIQVRIMEWTKSYIDQINSTYVTISSMRHDLQNHFVVLREFIRQEENRKTLDYIEALMHTIVDTKLHVKNPVLNALIDTKAREADSKMVRFTYDIAVPLTIPFSDVELCILFSNILDNAFDAINHVENISNRVIDITASTKKSYWVISCTNTTVSSSPFTSSTRLHTTKSSHNYHGIGTKQIVDISNRSGGYVTFTQKEKEFIAIVMIPIHDKGESNEHNN